MLRSALCTEAQLTSPSFLAWAERLRVAWDQGDTGRPVAMHRKVWEWIFIVEALHERGMLRSGMRGLGFGVGREPLAALFAGYGCEIVATDLPSGAATAHAWSSSEQHAVALQDLNAHGLCPTSDFERRVSFRPVDMNAVPADLTGFDFCWSSCAFEHLGSLAQGRRFVMASMSTLAPGGVAVHTTEFNVGSNDGTVDNNGTVLFRRKDIEASVDELRERGYRIDVDFDPGDRPADAHVDVAPFSDIHLKIELASYTVTSLGLVVERPRFHRLVLLDLRLRRKYVELRTWARPKSRLRRLVRR